MGTVWSPYERNKDSVSYDCIGVTVTTVTSGRVGGVGVLTENKRISREPLRDRSTDFDGIRPGLV